MLPLILFIVLIIVVTVLFEIRERQRAKAPISSGVSDAAKLSARPEGCCGEHLVCEKETLLQTNAAVEYYDDEELDALAGMDPTDYSSDQIEAIRAVFTSLQESDVSGWCRSLQLRNIVLPPEIREDALLIVRERRRA